MPSEDVSCSPRGIALQHSTLSISPRHSMYAIYAYIDPPNHPNVGKYAIHGVSGNGSGLGSGRCGHKNLGFRSTRPPFHGCPAWTTARTREPLVEPTSNGIRVRLDRRLGLEEFSPTLVASSY